MSKLAKQLIEENLRTKSPILDLGRCKLDGTEPMLGLLSACKHLETLIFSNSWREYNHQEGYWQEKDSQNQGKENTIKFLPESLPISLKKLVISGRVNKKWRISNYATIGKLINLEELYLSDNRIPTYSFFKTLSKLKVLTLNRNKIVKNGVVALKNLTNLEILDISKNQIQNINDLAVLINLKRIELASNQIQDIRVLSNLKELLFIDLNENEIKDITSLKDLTKLRILLLNDNNIQNISCLENLSQLSSLFLRGNKIQDISPLQNLTKLTTLSLHNNRIQDISPLENLTQLSRLYLGANEIYVSNLQFLQNLKKLKQLDLRYCKINHISLEFLNFFPNLKELYLANNPIQNIPREIFNKPYYLFTLQVVKDYLESITQDGKNKVLAEAKLVFVGLGSVGKSELADAIRDKRYHFHSLRSTTDSIRTITWSFSKEKYKQKDYFRTNIWDFAGQEINYNTHQFFLSKNTVYIFVWNYRKGEKQSEFHYWLNIVSLLSENSPILVVQNKIDEYNGDTNREDWLKKFPNIKGFYKTSCKTRAGIDILRDAIQKELLTLKQDVWNEKRFALRETLERSTKNYITYDEYLELCKDKELNEKQAGFLAEQLHLIGSILHYKDRISLQDTVILKSQWAIDAAYLLINSNLVIKGRFQEKDLIEIWQEQRFKTKHGFLLNLMEEFNLIFQLQNSNSYIIPEKLPNEKPNNFTPVGKPTLNFEYHYEFMPKGIISRFICRIHKEIKGELFWNFGVILEDKYQNQAEVLLHEASAIKVISIKVWGEEAHELLSIIRREFENVHQQLKNPSLNEVIPCYCDKCQKDRKNGHIFEYEHLKMALRINHKELLCKKGSLISVRKLVQGVLETDNQIVKDLEVREQISVDKLESEQDSILEEIYNLLEDGKLKEALKESSKLINRKHDLYSTLITIKTRFKEYETKSMQGINVSGILEKITTDFTQLLQTYED